MLILYNKIENKNKYYRIFNRYHLKEKFGKKEEITESLINKEKLFSFITFKT